MVGRSLAEYVYLLIAINTFLGASFFSCLYLQHHTAIQKAVFKDKLSLWAINITLACQSIFMDVLFVPWIVGVSIMEGESLGERVISIYLTVVPLVIVHFTKMRGVLLGDNFQMLIVASMLTPILHYSLGIGLTLNAFRKEKGATVEKQVHA